MTHPSFSLRDNVVEQFFPSVFHHHDHVGRGSDDLVPTVRKLGGLGVYDSQFDDMRMSQHFQVLDLSLDSGVHVWRSDLCSIDQLERDLMTGDAVRGNCHESMA